VKDGKRSKVILLYYDINSKKNGAAALLNLSGESLAIFYSLLHKLDN